MADIPRYRRHPSGLSLTAPMQVGDPAAMRSIQEVQQAIEEIRAVAAGASEFDSSGIESAAAELTRRVDALEANLNDFALGVKAKLAELSMLMMDIRYVKVTASQAGYVECVFWNAVEETELGVINVATEASHSAGDVIMAVPMLTGVSDALGNPVSWQEVGGGGGGYFIWKPYVGP